MISSVWPFTLVFSSECQVCKGALTFKKEGRQSVKIQLKDNPFKKADAGDSSLSADDLESLAITIANPPNQEMIMVLRTPFERDVIFRVLTKFCAERQDSPIAEGGGDMES
jgi:hypothetical protein